MNICICLKLPRDHAGRLKNCSRYFGRHIENNSLASFSQHWVFKVASKLVGEVGKLVAVVFILGFCC